MGSARQERSYAERNDVKRLETLTTSDARCKPTKLRLGAARRRRIVAGGSRGPTGWGGEGNTNF